MILYILCLLGLGEAQEIAITQHEGAVTFWYNSSNTHVATFSFDYCDIVSCSSTNWQCNMYRDTPNSRAIYICVTDSYWGQECDYWGAVGWNTGIDWGYQPQNGLARKDRNGKSLISRMILRKTGTCLVSGKTGEIMKLTLTIENPSPGDAGVYVLGNWMKGGIRGVYGKFRIQDMYNSKDWQMSQKSPKIEKNPMAPRIQTFQGMIATAGPSFQDTMAIGTGFSDTNLWLEWIKYTTQKYNKSNCYVCAAARPHLGTVPLNIPINAEECFISLYTNTSTNHSQCEDWKQKYSLTTETPKPGEGITVYKGNYTCYESLQGNRFLGNFSQGYCDTFSKIPSIKLQNQVQSLGDIYWICGDLKLRTRLEGNWTGQCALTKILMPMHIIPVGTEKSKVLSSPIKVSKREAPAGSLDSHVYIDAIGVPRGVPDEFKARDQVKAGFESFFMPLVTVNKNVDWINYIYYNQQRFVNYTRDALQGLADQLGPTSTMTFQNRMALDMILAEKGGVCHMIGDACCTYIPGNTGPDGKVTTAINKLKDLSDELKRNSGITDPWDKYFSWLSGWRQWLTQLAIFLLVILFVLAVVVFCVIPCCKGLCKKAGSEVIPTMVMYNKDDIDLEDIPLQKSPKMFNYSTTKLE
ncbi:uncharacterized protein LOC142493251 [Ascaphus truei]|uniref:uncharacterized protein LOC142493251 n=1 Tax=Ascaphus truei TaxID=8439 RepID=UPI003F597607